MVRQNKMKNTKEPSTYEGEVLAILAFEFGASDQDESERKIERRLRDKKLGPYNQDRIDTLRRFKDDVQEELGKSNKSKFWKRSHGEYADMQDWDFDGLLDHMQKKHSGVPEKTIGSFLPYAIYLYYLR